MDNNNKTNTYMKFDMRGKKDGKGRGTNGNNTSIYREENKR